MRVPWFSALVWIPVTVAGSDYRASIEQWRQQREASLRSEDGWLTVAGLFWLEEGDNAVGSASGSAVLLPADAAPAKAGVIRFREGRAFFTAAPGAEVRLHGKPVHSMELRSDAAGQPDVLEIGRLKLLLIKRGTRYAIRVKDPESALRKSFRGLKWFPIREEWRIEARYLPASGSRKLVLETIVGTSEEMESAGFVEFEREGKTWRLEAARSGERLFIVFRDATAGKTSYAAGRFLYTDAPRDGRVVLDFNRAINPPCAYTPYTTCPLPPPQNRLPIAIPAGEMAYEGHGTGIAER